MSISLCSISNINHNLVGFAFEKTLQTVIFDETLFFSNKKINLGNNYTFKKLSKNFSRNDYSWFMFKELHKHVKTSHVLIIQYDGFAVNQQAWTDVFYDYDYIGAPIHLYNPVLGDIGDKRSYGFTVGNGGFSLRSKKLLDILGTDEFLKPLINNFVCEDLAICIEHKDYLIKKYDIKFAPIDVALRFSMESVQGQIYSLGFHGIENIPFFLSEDETFKYINQYVDTNHVNLFKVQKFFNNVISMNYYHLATALSKYFRIKGINFPLFEYVNQ